MMRRLLQPVWILLAVIFLIEAWLWDHLEPIVAWVVALIPLRAFKQWLADRVDTLSPAMTLIVFIVPVIPLFPLKMVGLWLLTHEYWISAILTIIFAKFLGVGVAAFIFDVTRPKLLEMEWFEKLYEFVIALRAKAQALVDPIKARIMTAARRRRRLVIAHAAADPALPQERARSAAAKIREARGCRGSPPQSRPLRAERGKSNTSYGRCSRCGMNMPSTVKAMPASASRPEIQASAIMPVMMVAEASTMPI